MPPFLVVGFACLGHFAVHLLGGLHATAALAIEREWSIGYGEIIALGIWGAILMAAAAPAAGWLADRVGPARLMVVFFLGSGLAAVATAMSGGPVSLATTLALLGLFGAIYHPVGLAWLLGGVGETRRGRAVGINGLFGSLGFAAAPPMAGLLAETASWRLAFLLPGLATVGLGLLLTVCLWRERSANRHGSPLVAEPGVINSLSRASGARRALPALATAMLTSSLLYSAFVTALPKWAEGRMAGEWPDADLGIVGIAVGIVLMVGGVGQVLAGHVADRYDPRALYIAALGSKPLLLVLAVLTGGPAGLLAAALLILVIDIASPSETLLLARWTPTHRRGLALGVRYAAALAATPAGIGLAAVSHAQGGHDGLLLVLAGLAAIATIAALALPRAVSSQPHLSRRIEQPGSSSGS